MRERCPKAVAVGPAVLRDYRRVFRSWADVEPAVGAWVCGGVWRITGACLVALDDYEEIETGLYRRVTLTVETDDGDVVEAFVYRMTATAYAPPDAEYLAGVLDGCRDFAVDRASVLAAVEAARHSLPAS